MQTNKYNQMIIEKQAYPLLLLQKPIWIVMMRGVFSFCQSQWKKFTQMRDEKKILIKRKTVNLLAKQGRFWPNNE